MTMLNPKKGDRYAMCKHIAGAKFKSEHWYLLPQLHGHLWVSLCGSCATKVDHNPKGPMPITHFGELDEDVDIVACPGG